MTGLGTPEKMPRRFPVSVEMYHILGEQGAFDPDERIELIGGEIYEMSPIGSLHARCVKLLAKFLFEKFSGTHIISVQDPITLDDMSEPEPDLAIVRYRDDFYKDTLPTSSDVLLVIEVADSSLDFDRTKKLPRYATAGIPEFWLIDLESDRVEIHSQPKPETYGLVKVLRRGETAVSESLPGLRLSVDSILG